MGRGNNIIKAASRFRDQLFIDSRKVKDLKRHYNSFSYEWRGIIQPTELSSQYSVRIIVDDNKVETFVDGITKDDFGTVPHLFSNGSLCLYYQFGEKPEFSFLNCSASDYLAWVTKWLLFYELWKVTGEWYGGGIGHD